MGEARAKCLAARGDARPTRDVVVKISQKFYRFFTDFHFEHKKKVLESVISDILISLFFTALRESTGREQVEKSWSDLVGYTRIWSHNGGRVVGFGWTWSDWV